MDVGVGIGVEKWEGLVAEEGRQRDKRRIREEVIIVSIAFWNKDWAAKVNA